MLLAEGVGADREGEGPTEHDDPLVRSQKEERACHTEFL